MAEPGERHAMLVNSFARLLNVACVTPDSNYADWKSWVAASDGRSSSMSATTYTTGTESSSLSAP
eukprot:scaffold4387_cov400-Prasinococcus_capsulatus_cf.AAC.15